MIPRSQQQASTVPSSSSSQQGRKRRGRKGKAPFSVANEKGREEVLLTGSRLCCGWGVSVGALEALAHNWNRFLSAICPAGRIPHPLPGLYSSPLSHPDIASDASGRISSITGLAPGGREDVVQGCLGNCL